MIDLLNMQLGDMYRGAVLVSGRDVLNPKPLRSFQATLSSGQGREKPK